MNAEPRRMKPHPADDPVAEKLAWWMDSAIKIGPISIGLDGLIGLIPGLGDLLTDVVGAWIVLRAIQNGAHRAAILRMVVNMAIDSAVGSVPVLGDLFDFAFKSNTRNLRIYRESLGGTRNPRRDWAFVALILALLLVLIALPVLATVYLLQAVISWLLQL
jgi:hypothetical protein